MRILLDTSYLYDPMEARGKFRESDAGAAAAPDRREAGQGGMDVVARRRAVSGRDSPLVFARFRPGFGWFSPCFFPVFSS